jgi:hypothetical protein
MTIDDLTKRRFAAKVQQKGADECWPWLGCKVHGYGQVQIGGRRRRAHQVALELAGVQRPSSQHFACHLCDNPGCVNPAHIWWGTHQENMRDMSGKGRHKNQRKTHCKRGHLLTEDNCLPSKLRIGQRVCSICQNEARRKVRVLT